MRGERGDAAGAARWFGQLIARYAVDPRSSVARFRLAFEAARRGLLDSAAALYQSEVTAGAPQRMGARFWLGKLALQRGDTAAARATWLSLARDDSIGYYGLRARRETGSPPLAFAAATPPLVPPGVVAALGRLDPLMLAGLHSAGQAEGRGVLARAPQELEALLVWSDRLAQRGFRPAAVRLGGQAGLRAPHDPPGLPALFPRPKRGAVEAPGARFGLGPPPILGNARAGSGVE